jgi:hypothetical protein
VSRTVPYPRACGLKFAANFFHTEKSLSYDTVRYGTGRYGTVWYDRTTLTYSSYIDTGMVRDRTVPHRTGSTVPYRYGAGTIPYDSVRVKGIYSKWYSIFRFQTKSNIRPQ